MQAVYELATGTGRIQDRLHAASDFLGRVKIDEVPKEDEMRADFARVLNALQRPTREMSDAEKALADGWGRPKVACGQFSDAIESMNDNFRLAGVICV